MSKRLIIVRDPAEAASYEVYDDPIDVPGLLMQKFETWPETARVYHNFVSQAHDVTPIDSAGVDRLDELDGDIFVVVYPGFFIGFLIVAIVAVVAVVVLLAPKVPEVNNTNRQATSPNNELSERSNRSRLNSRIPDIYGIVRSTPDMIMPEYKYYEANKKVEVAYMCIGRGEYEIYDVRDNQTLLAHVPGSAAAFYGPNTSPNSGSPPQLSIGAPIDEPLVRAKRLEQVVGQELRPPNAATITSPDFKFQFPDRIYNSTGISLQDRFSPDDQLQVQAVYTGVSGSINRTAFARYVWDTTNHYVEWQAGDPSAVFLAGDTIQISGAATTGVKDTFTVSTTRQASFSSTGRVYFEDGDEPIEAGLDFRLNKDFVLTGATLSYNYQGTYTITAKTSTKLTLSNPAGVNDDWTHLQNSSAYSTVTVNGIARSVRFLEAGEIELQSGNFDDVNFPTQTTVVVGSAPYTTSLSGTYRASSRSAAQDYWQLDTPEGSNAEWLEIDGTQRTRTISVTIQQTHIGDTMAIDCGGTYTIANVTTSRIYLSNPAAVNGDWNLLTQLVNNRTEYGGTTDTFYVGAPTRTVNLTGTYTIVSVGQYEIILSNPSFVAPDWEKLEFFSNEEVQPASTGLATSSGNNWIGPFFVDVEDSQWLYFNFVAANGIYKDSGKTQYSATMDIQVQIYPADSAGFATGAAPLTYNILMTGSAVQRDTIASTLKVNLPQANRGYNLVYARRATPKDTVFEGTSVDTVKWEDVYVLSPEVKSHFGDITTVHTKTRATGGALALKDRKLNCLVGRKLPIITGFSGQAPNFTPIYAPDLQVTVDGGQIFCALSIDPKFGARAPEEIDFFGILGARSRVNDYFGDTGATEFSYTFDNTNVSYEEAATAIANACFCVAYRQGSLIKWKPEIATSDSVLIFNHRNKLPDTESRTVRFASENDQDSVVLEWVNPEDDSIETFTIPKDESGVSTKKLDVLGVRNYAQATWHAWRGYYKMLYQSTSVEFEATQEAAILVTRDRVLVADNTRADTQDGEVLEQDILQLTLSQEVELKSGVSYTCFLQHVDGSVEAIPCTPVPSNITGLVRNVVWLPDGGFRWAYPTQAAPNPAEVGIFSTGDDITITVTSFNHPTLGTVNLDGTYEVTAVDGISGTVMLKDPELVNPNWTKVTGEFYRAGVNFNASKYSKRKINLTWAPRLPLNLAPDSYSRATYLLRGNDEIAPQAFMVVETRPKDNFSYQVTCSNYDPRFYYMDDLEFWLNFDEGLFADASARGRPVSISTATGKATIAYNAERKSNVFNNAANSSAAWVQSSDLPGGADNYTKAAWVRHSGGFDAYFLTNANEQFRCNGSNRLIAGHGAITLTYPNFQSNAGVWHHIACTYEKDIQGGRLRLYYDGLLVAQRVNVPASAGGNLQPIGNGSSGVIYSQCDDVRYWRRAFTEGDIQELYNSTR